MARSWRNFFKRDEDELEGSGVGTKTGVPAEDTEEAARSGEDVPAAEEVLADREEPAATDVSEFKEAALGEVEAALPVPDAVVEASDAKADAERQEYGGWFGRLQRGFRRSR